MWICCNYNRFDTGLLLALRIVSGLIGDLDLDLDIFLDIIMTSAKLDYLTENYPRMGVYTGLKYDPVLLSPDSEQPSTGGRRFYYSL